MDKRKGSTHARSRGRVEGQSGHPGSSRRKGRPMTTEMEGQEHDVRRK